MGRDRLWQLVFVTVAAAATAAGALLQPVLLRERQRLELDLATSDPNILKDPKTIFLQLAPGGLRAPFINYLWIRSQELKQDGKFFDAKQQRDLICDLMPHCSGVWAFHAWDMAWNISVATHTPQERWMWVNNGITLLRDRGLYYNPKELVLYKELAWIYFSKIGQYSDEMHMTYKRRLAGQLHRVLGGPPVSGLTRDAIQAIRLVADAPQTEQALASDPQAGAFLAAMETLGVPADGRFLDYYNRFSRDVLVGSYEHLLAGGRTLEPRLRQIEELMRSDAHAPGRAKVLAYVRRKTLVEQFRLDPNWMVQLMERYGPLDWRGANAHGLYWSALGMHLAGGMELSQINSLNTGRTTLDSLQVLTRTGLLSVYPDPRNPDEPLLNWDPDWRFIEPAHQEYLRCGAILVVESDKEKYKGQSPEELLKKDPGLVGTPDNMLRDAHINYLANSIQFLYVGGREDLAQHYYDELRTALKPVGDLYNLSLGDYVRYKVAEGGTPMSEMAKAFWASALRNAYRALAGGDHDSYLHHHAFARKAYERFRQDTGQAPRLKPREFEEEERDFLIRAFIQPEAVLMYMPLLAKVQMYNALPADRRLAIYPYLLRPLQMECQDEGLDFDRAFPVPPGYKPPAAPAGG